jgi:class 3 adenylate cyclase
VSRADCAIEKVNFIIEKYFSTFPDILLANGGDINETAGDRLVVIFQGEVAQSRPRAQPRTAISSLTLHDRGLMEFDNVAEPAPVFSLVRDGVGNGQFADIRR